MLDIRNIVENREEIEANLLKRGKAFDLKSVVSLDEKRKAIILDTEEKESKKRIF